MNPPEHADAFLASCGWAGARIEPLAGDASFRRYFRVIGDGRQAVLMDAPPPHEDPRPFVAVAEWLISRGLTAPEILARDLDKGLLLLADLGDARRDVPAEIEREMIDRYVAATGHGEAFERAYWALAAQRNTRILGVFTRLWKRDNKPHYRRFQPRMWGLLERDLAQPHLAPVRDWFDRNVPAEWRREPWKEAA
jgi:aminoglycoside/choline kinase family phosphotransferase